MVAAAEVITQDTSGSSQIGAGATETQPEKGDMRVVSEDWGDMDEVDW